MTASSIASSRALGLRLPVDITTWATVEESDIKAAKDRAKYKRRRDAVSVYGNTQSLKEAARIVGTSERNFRRLWGRCCALAPDGRPWGFRALVPNKVTRKVSRKELLRSLKGVATKGFPGSFEKLLIDFPSIRTELVAALGRLGPEAHRPVTMKGRQLQLQFERLCFEAGLTQDDYPFNTRERCRRSLPEWVKRVYLPQYAFAYVKGEHGQDAATGFDFQKEGDARRAPAKAWDEWQLDEVKIDVYARYEFLSPDLVPISLELPRIVAVVLKDTGSGAVPAWKLVIGREVNVGDLLEVLWTAVSGPPKVQPSVPGSDYQDGAGYPSVVLEGLRWAWPRVLPLDNALAHLANDLRNAVEKIGGSKVLLGKPKTPLARAEIESEFSALARKVLHQLPGTTGSGPTDPRRKKAATPLEGLIRVEDLEHTLDVYFANRNGLPHAASNYVAPLERLRHNLERGLLSVAVLPPDRRHAHVFGLRREVTVRADLRKGRPPFVNFMKLRYRGPALTPFTGYVGKRLVVRASPMDLRTIVLYDEQGCELGVLRAEGKWGALPHDLRIRRLFLKLRRENSLGKQAEDDPLRALFAHLNKGAQRDATQAGQLAYLMRYLRGYSGELSPSLLSDIGARVHLEKAANDISEVALLPPPEGRTPSVPKLLAPAPNPQPPTPKSPQQPAAQTITSARPVYVLAQKRVRR
ncbi:Mu transposase C-terminal domain-containing protein [Rhizobacter sp. OV335]|uniref:Mu transposase C-terminal domain-containing protein n=1 Tax=Rhizobacter sp. OV335 TaxID=1500264 RepID=UPI000913DC44|nr:Mu transposase C-terminal domain-containing protein [Rhizobacter sp. OV335]SHN13564.1 Mu transposase, C-terminal [Rhizobacter sp. OV335]